jgi:OOP family OmpA-OmpF porin
MTDREQKRESPEGTAPVRRSRFLFPVIALIVLAVAVGFLWQMGTRIQKLEHRLTASEQRADAATEKMLQYAREREEARAKANEALKEASQAKTQAEQEASARLQAELEADRKRQESEIAQARAQHALDQSKEARAEADQAREELTGMRQRREAELNRMQEALNHIAPTRRTPTGMVMQLSDEAFQFDFDSAALRQENREKLSRIAGVLLASEGYRLFIDGHTDDVGSTEYNLDLSQRRARSVRDYLVEAGIPNDIVAVHGFGKSNPLVKEKTREARQKNRRVEIGIVDTIINYKQVLNTAEKK